MAKRIELNVNGRTHTIEAEPDMPLLYALRDDLGMNNPRFGCGLGAMRRLHGAAQRRAGALLRDCRSIRSATRKITTLNGIGTAGEAAQGAGRLHRGAGAAMRLLPQRLGHDLGGAAREEPASERRADPRGAVRHQVPLRHPCQRSCAPSSARPRLEGGSHEHRTSIAVICSPAPAPSSSRSRLPGVKARAAIATQARASPLKPDQLATYISINQDGSAVGWVGKVDMGQGTEIGWIKMIAEELDLPTDRVSMVQGHTDLTINQGGASGSTGIWKARRGAAQRRRRSAPRAGRDGVREARRAGRAA